MGFGDPTNQLKWVSRCHFVELIVINVGLIRNSGQGFMKLLSS